MRQKRGLSGRGCFWCKNCTSPPPNLHIERMHAWVAWWESLNCPAAQESRRPSDCVIHAKTLLILTSTGLFIVWTPRSLYFWTKYANGLRSSARGRRGASLKLLSIPIFVFYLSIVAFLDGQMLSFVATICGLEYGLCILCQIPLGRRGT